MRLSVPRSLHGVWPGYHSSQRRTFPVCERAARPAYCTCESALGVRAQVNDMRDRCRIIAVFPCNFVANALGSSRGKRSCGTHQSDWAQANSRMHLRVCEYSDQFVVNRERTHELCSLDVSLDLCALGEVAVNLPTVRSLSRIMRKHNGAVNQQLSGPPTPYYQQLVRFPLPAKS